MPYFGEIAALAASLCWAIGSSLFEDLGKKASALTLNFYKVFVALIFLFAYGLIFNGSAFPKDVPFDAVTWLSISGFIGLVLGDFFFLEAISIMGATVTLLIYACSPPMSAILAYFILNQSMSGAEILGMLVTLLGIAMVIFVKPDKGKRGLKLNYPAKGIAFAFFGSLGQALGYVISRLGLENVEAIDASLIRMSAALIGLLILLVYRGRAREAVRAVSDLSFTVKMTVGAFVGSFLGVTLSLAAVKYTSAGIASTLSALSPIMILPISFFIKKQPITVKEMLGAVVAVVGVGLIFVVV